MAKKVLIFSLAYFPHVGGAEVALKEITDRIRPEDMEFHMLTLRLGKEPREEKVGNVFVHRIGGGSSYLAKIFFVPRAALATRVLHRTHHFDALWAMMSYMLFPLVLSGIRRPYLLTLQEGDPFEHVFRRWFIRPFAFLLALGFRNATAVQAISNYLLAWAKQMGFRGIGEVIPNGVDTARFARAYAEEDIARMRQSLGKKEGDIFLVTTSRLVRKNAVDDVIRALALLPKNVRFVIYGTGREEAKLRALAHELRVADRVHFMGQISHEEMPLALKACDIFVRPSRSEGMGNSFVEAMAAGLPVIASQEGGIADFLFDAKRNPDKPSTGWAVDVDTPAQIARAVTQILESPTEVERVKKNAQELVFAQYDWSRIALTMDGLLDQVIEVQVD